MLKTQYNIFGFVGTFEFTSFPVNDEFSSFRKYNFWKYNVSLALRGKMWNFLIYFPDNFRETMSLSVR